MFVSLWVFVQCSRKRYQQISIKLLLEKKGKKIFHNFRLHIQETNTCQFFLSPFYAPFPYSLTFWTLEKYWLSLILDRDGSNVVLVSRNIYLKTMKKKTNQGSSQMPCLLNLISQTNNVQVFSPKSGIYIPSYYWFQHSPNLTIWPNLNVCIFELQKRHVFCPMPM